MSFESCPQVTLGIWEAERVNMPDRSYFKEADQKKLGKKPWMTPSAVCDFFDKEIPAFGGMTEQAALSRGIVPAPEGRRLFAVRKSPENPFGPGCASLSGECLAGVYFLRFWF